MRKTAPAATAIYADTYSGPVAATLEPFRTKRRGQTVTRWRWIQANGTAAGGFIAGGFATPAAGLSAVARHVAFSSVAAC